jgi:hypothetical protein
VRRLDIGRCSYSALHVNGLVCCCMLEKASAREDAAGFK